MTSTGNSYLHPEAGDYREMIAGFFYAQCAEKLTSERKFVKSLSGKTPGEREGDCELIRSGRHDI